VYVKFIASKIDLISSKTKCGAAGDVNMDVVNDFKQNVKLKTQNYSNADIYNTDETAFNFKKTYHRTQCQKHEKPQAQDSSSTKLRATVLLTVSKAGEKLTPFLYGTKP
jgi:hypothetical protein